MSDRPYPPPGRPVRPPGVPERWDFETQRREVGTGGDPTDASSYPGCWCWNDGTGEWSVVSLRGWSLTATGWWATVGYPSGSYDHVHSWRLRSLEQ